MFHFCLAQTGQNPDPEETEEMIDEVDADGSGSINFPEFIELMIKKQQGGQTKDEIKQAFRVFDKDGNGYVSSSELKFVMSRSAADLSSTHSYRLQQQQALF